MSNKIFIVDDDAEIRKVIGIYLENEGYVKLQLLKWKIIKQL